MSPDIIAMEPCPFCGHKEPEVGSVPDSTPDDPKRRQAFVWCPKCKSDGPLGPFISDAVKGWNQRVKNGRK